MRVVAGMLVVVVAVLAMAGGGSTATASIMIKNFTWSDCGNSNSIFQVTNLDVTSPLNIPGQLTIKELEVTPTSHNSPTSPTGPTTPTKPTSTISPTSPTSPTSSTLLDDALITFHIETSSSFSGFNRTVPCFPQQGGSCGYKLCDMLTLSDTSSRVTQQAVKALTSAGLNTTCPLSGSISVTLRNVTIDVPSMLHTDMDLFLNTNNYFVTTKLVSADLQTELGCVEVSMPVYKPCQGQGWLCMKSIDFINRLMNPSP